MSENVILRTTKFGQTGFVIEDVNQYLDELNDKIIHLEEELAKANAENDNLKKALDGKGIAVPSESLAELADAKSEIERLKGLMKVASSDLDFERAIKLRDEINELKKQLNKYVMKFLITIGKKIGKQTM